MDCECEATITNINDFTIITTLHTYSLGNCPNGFGSDLFNCYGCDVIPAVVLTEGKSISSGNQTISNMFGDEFNYFTMTVQPVGTEESCPRVNVVIDCGGNQTISQNYTLPAHRENEILRNIKIAQFINEQTDPDWNGLPWTGTWEESCSLTPTLQWWNFPCKNPLYEQLVTPCWPNGI